MSKRGQRKLKTSKISHKIQSGYGGYGHSSCFSRRSDSRSYGKRRGGRRSRGGKGDRGFHRGGGYRSINNHPTVENPKNLPRRGGFQNKDRT